MKRTNGRRKTKRKNDGSSARILASISRGVARDTKKAKLKAAREAVAAAKADAEARKLAARDACKAERAAVTARLKDERKAALLAIKERAKLERAVTRTECQARRASVGGTLAEARAALEAERAAQRAERTAWKERPARSTAKERASESDDAMRANLEPEELALFERVKRQIVASPGRSRLEAFRQYVEEHPDEARRGGSSDVDDRAMQAAFEARDARRMPSLPPPASSYPPAFDEVPDEAEAAYQARLKLPSRELAARNRKEFDEREAAKEARARAPSKLEILAKTLEVTEQRAAWEREAKAEREAREVTPETVLEAIRKGESTRERLAAWFPASKRRELAAALDGLERSQAMHRDEHGTYRIGERDASARAFRAESAENERARLEYEAWYAQAQRDAGAHHRALPKLWSEESVEAFKVAQLRAGAERERVEADAQAEARARVERDRNVMRVPKKIVATSKERHRASAAERRAHGGATVTTFYVHYEEDDRDPSKWKEIDGYGKTPGERKTDAIQRFRQMTDAPVTDFGNDQHAKRTEVWAAREAAKDAARSLDHATRSTPRTRQEKQRADAAVTKAARADARVRELEAAYAERFGAPLRTNPRGGGKPSAASRTVDMFTPTQASGTGQGSLFVELSPSEQEKIKRAAIADYEAKHWGHKGNEDVSEMRAPDPTAGVLVQMGELVSVTYRTSKKGDPRGTYYEHEFSAPLPILAYSDEGLIICAGKYTVSDRGIID